MSIGWDNKKAALNLKNHKVGFDEASTVLADPLVQYSLNDHPDGNRWEYIGHSYRNNLLYVVTVEETEEEIRIISAREATPSERKQYEKG